MSEKQALEIKLLNDVDALAYEVVEKVESRNSKNFVEVNSTNQKYQLAIDYNDKLKKDYYDFLKKYTEIKERIDRLDGALSNKINTMLYRLDARIGKTLVLNNLNGTKNYEYNHTLIINGKQYFSKTTADSQLNVIEFISDAVINAKYDLNQRHTQKDIDKLVEFENSFLYSKFLGTCIADMNRELKDCKQSLRKEQDTFGKTLNSASDEIIALKCATVYNNNKQALAEHSANTEYAFDKVLGADNKASYYPYFDNFDENNSAFETATKLHDINVLSGITSRNWEEVTDCDYIAKYSEKELPSYLKQENGVLLINPSLCNFGELPTNLQIGTFETAKITNMSKQSNVEKVQQAIDNNIWLKNKDNKNSINTDTIASYSKLMEMLNKNK